MDPARKEECDSDHGERGRGNNGGERDVTGKLEYHAPDSEYHEAYQGHHPNDYAERSSNPFASFEAQPHRETMAEDAAEGSGYACKAGIEVLGARMLVGQGNRHWPMSGDPFG